MAAPVQPRAPPRYFRNDLPLSRRNSQKQLTASLDRLVNDYPPDKVPPSGGLYSGLVGVALLFFRLQQLYPEMRICDDTLGTWLAAYLGMAQTHMKGYPGPTAERSGVSDDILALLALSAASAKDKEMAWDLCTYGAVTMDENGGDEWLYGRAGYLYLLRLARAAFEDDGETTARIDETVELVIDTIMGSSRPWRWHGKAYLGAVHGSIGIITQVVLSDPGRAPELETELATVLGSQYPSGNWPASLPPDKDRLVQFCHGAPRIVSSLQSIRQHFPRMQERIDKAIKHGQACILERGLLTKEPCLCHGISGNALALEDAEFEHWLTFTTGNEIKQMAKDGLMTASGDPAALWGGEAGRAWAWAVADKRLEKRFLGYNDI